MFLPFETTKNVFLCIRKHENKLNKGIPNLIFSLINYGILSKIGLHFQQDLKNICAKNCQTKSIKL